MQPDGKPTQEAQRYVALLPGCDNSLRFLLNVVMHVGSWIAEFA
jgi:hypothetical protein